MVRQRVRRMERGEGIFLTAKEAKVAKGRLGLLAWVVCFFDREFCESGEFCLGCYFIFNREIR